MHLGYCLQQEFCVLDELQELEEESQELEEENQEPAEQTQEEPDKQIIKLTNLTPTIKYNA